MQRIRPDVDIVKDVLEAVLAANPSSEFVQSLLFQYQERGGLSKKQLQGLFSKAQQINSIPPGKLATLEAIILKKPNRYKSDLPDATPLYEKDEKVGEMIKKVLQKYPEHKRVIFFQTKYENNEPLSPTEMMELERFCKVLK